MRSRVPLILTTTALAVVLGDVALMARGGGRGGGGGGARVSGGGSYSRPSGGGSYSRPSGSGSYSRPSGSGSYTRPSGGGSYSKPSGGSSSVNKPSQQPATKPSGGMVPSTPASPSTRPSGGGSAANGGSATQLPSGSRPGTWTGGASQLPAKPGTGGGSASPLPAQPGAGTGGARPSQPIAKPGTGGDVATRPGAKPGQLPSQGDLNNFLGIAAGGAAISQLPATRPGGGERPGTLPAQPGIADRPGAGARPPTAGTLPAKPTRPEERPNWGDWSQNRSDEWHQRVDNRHDTWNNWQQQNQQRLDNFQNNREQRWNHLEDARNDRQNWRNQNREDWQQHRRDMWDYRFDRAGEVWDNCRDFYDDVFDDRWWGRYAWWGFGGGYYGFGHYPANPWWWWRPVRWTALGSWLWGTAPEPYYIDYGVIVIYEDDTVYVDNQPVPAAEYTQPMVDLALNIEKPPPPMPPAEGQTAEWLPLGVFALVQEEKGDPVMFFQLSVSKEGIISGAYQSVLTDDQRAVAGQVDKTTQRAAWRIGEHKGTVYITSLANLTQDVSPVTIQFDAKRTQTWLLVRMPEPTPSGEHARTPEMDRTLPPVKPSAPAK